MKIGIALIIIFLPLTGAYSELITGENFSVDFNNAARGVNCDGVAQAYQVETLQLNAEQSSQFSNTLKKINEAKVMLGSVKVAADLQKNWLLKLIPGMYDNIGSQCVYYSVQATRRGISAAHDAAAKVDEKLAEVDFEIGGEEFDGPGVKILREVEEAKKGKGTAAKPIIEINSAVREVISAMQLAPASGAAVAAGQAAVLLISTKGPIAKIAALHSNATAALEALALEEETELASTREQSQELQEEVEMLREKGAGNLGLSEMQRVEENFETVTGIAGAQSSGQSIAELVEEAAAGTAKAKNIIKTAKDDQRGRTARRIKTLRKATQILARAKNAATRAEKALTEISTQLEAKALQARAEARQAAQNAISPTRRKMAEAVITAPLPPSTTASQRLLNLAEEIKRAELATNLATEQTATLQQRAELKSKAEELAKKAVQSSEDDVEAGEIAQLAAQIAKTLEQPLTQEELLETQRELTSLEAALAEKMQEKYDWLQEEFDAAKHLYLTGQLDAEQEQKFKQLSRMLNQNNLLPAIGMTKQLEKTLAEITLQAEKQSTEASEKELKKTQLLQSNETQSQRKTNDSLPPVPQNNFLAQQITDALQEFEEKKNNGMQAFYSEKTTRKTLAELGFENAEKKAQRLATKLEKLKDKKLAQLEEQTTVEMLAELRDATSEMESSVNDMQAQATLEIALAGQRAIDSPTQTEVAKAEEKMKLGRFAEAYQIASEVNKKITTQQQPSTAQVTAFATGGTDYREWAVAGSAAVILIGAAYLLKRKPPQGAYVDGVT